MMRWSLLGAALCIRRPDARRSTPLLAFGLGLLMLGTLLRVAQGPIEGLINGLELTEDASVFPTPASVAYSVFSSLVNIAAIVYVAAGLSITRERAPGRGERMALKWLATIGIVIVLLPYAVIGIDRVRTQTDWLVVGLTVGPALLHALAWSYLIATTLGGWLHDEHPRPAWAVISVGGLILLAIQLLSTLLIIIGNFRSEPLQLMGLFTLVSAAATLVWVLFLAAFSIGLPALPERAETPETTAAIGG